MVTNDLVLAADKNTSEFLAHILCPAWATAAPLPHCLHCEIKVDGVNLSSETVFITQKTGAAKEVGSSV